MSAGKKRRRAIQKKAEAAGIPYSAALRKEHHRPTTEAQLRDYLSREVRIHIDQAKAAPEVAPVLTARLVASLMEFDAAKSNGGGARGDPMHDAWKVATIVCTHFREVMDRLFKEASYESLRLGASGLGPHPVISVRGNVDLLLQRIGPILVPESDGMYEEYFANAVEEELLGTWDDSEYIDADFHG